jgi:hypothetical protein
LLIFIEPLLAVENRYSVQQVNNLNTPRFSYPYGAMNFMPAFGN